MTNWSPPSIPRKWLTIVAVLYAVGIGYSIVVLGQILLGVLPGLVLIPLYVVWRFLAAVEAIAEAQQRSADAREQMAVQRE
jgi:hypothetical protein